MRTRKARQLVRRGLLIARVRGHQPTLISHSGAMILYGCKESKCYALLEGWDNPDNVCGPMVHTNCGTEIGWFRKQLLKLIAL